MKKRIIAMLMCMVLMIGIMPVTALATDGNEFSDNDDLAIFWYSYSDFLMREIRTSLNEKLDAADIPYKNYDADGDQATQNDQIDTAIDNGAKLLVVNIVDIASVDAAQTIVEKAEAADIPVIFFNREVYDSVIRIYENACYVGIETAEAGGKQGKMAADYIIKNYEEVDLNGDGEISYIMMKGQDGNPEAEMRTRYAVEFCNNALIAAGKPALKYFNANNSNCYEPSNWSWVTAQELMANAISAYPMNGDAPIEVVLTNNDDAALGCVNALNNVGWNTGEGKSIPVFGIDGTVDALNLMEAGKMTGSVTQSVDGMAETVASLIDNVANGKHVFDGAEENFNTDDGTAKIRVPFDMILEGEIYESDYDYDYDFDYDYDTGWGDDIYEGVCGDDLTWVIDGTRTMTISGEGPMWDYTEEYPPWNEYMWRVENVEIKDGVTHIGKNAFSDGYNIENITIPASISSIDEYAFAVSYIYGDIWVDEENEYFSSDENGNLFNKDKTELVFLTSGEEGIYTVPASVVKLKKYSCSGAWDLWRLVFEGNAPIIEENAFRELSAAIFYPKNDSTWTAEKMQDYDGYVTWYSYDPAEPDYTIWGKCGEDLTWTIDMEGTLVVSGKGELRLSYSEDEKEWGKYSWNDITSIIIEDGVTFIDWGILDNYYSLESIMIPASVTKIDSIIQWCENLVEIIVDEDNPNYSSDENGVLFNKDKTELIRVPSAINVETYRVPDSVIEINEYAFNSFLNVTEIIISSNVAEIGVDAFSNFDSVNAIIVEEDNQNYSSDEYGVLYNKDKSEIIYTPPGITGTYVVPASVTTVTFRSFSYAYGLDEIVFVGNAPSFEGEDLVWWPIAAYYPENNPTWTKEVMQRFGSEITWVAYSLRPQGDVNGDGKITNSDLVRLARYLVEWYEDDVAADIRNYGDVNGDGRVTNSDLVRLARVLVGE